MSDQEVEDVVRPVPSGTVEGMQATAAQNGGEFNLPPEHAGAFGRTMFDAPNSQDGSVTVVMAPEQIEGVPSQSLVRVRCLAREALPRREYVGSVVAGPFAEPDGMRADSPALVISAVAGTTFMPKHHGRIQVEILGEEVNGRLIPPRRRPRPNSPVYLIDDSEMPDILALHGGMRLGLVDGHDVQIRVPADRKSVLCRHTGVLGTTGGGKSNTVARLVTELQSNDVAVVILDTEGEYTTLNKETDNADLVRALDARGLQAQGVTNTHLYHLLGRECANPSHPDRHSFSLRFSAISPWALKEILDLSGAQEVRLLDAYELTKALCRDLGVFPRKNNADDEKKVLDLDEFESGWPGMRLDHLCFVISAILGIMEGKQGNEFRFAYAGAKEFHAQENWDSVRRKILAAVFKEDSDEDKGAKKKTKSGGGADRTSWWALNSRLSRLRKLNVFDSAESLKFGEMLKPGRVSIIDLSDLENGDVRNLAIAEILRGIQLKQDDIYMEAVSRGAVPPPVNVIVEEAHEFLSVHRIREMPILREQIEKIAKRGRKRYLGLTFVTQLPSHLPDEVLALINNWVLHKITDHDVIRRLKRMVPGVDDSMWRLIPSLAAGQALVSFTHMKRPLIASVDPAPAMLRMTD